MGGSLVVMLLPRARNCFSYNWDFSLITLLLACLCSINISNFASYSTSRVRSSRVLLTPIAACASPSRTYATFPCRDFATLVRCVLSYSRTCCCWTCLASTSSCLVAWMLCSIQTRRCLTCRQSSACPLLSQSRALLRLFLRDKRSFLAFSCTASRSACLTAASCALASRACLAYSCFRCRKANFCWCESALNQCFCSWICRTDSRPLSVSLQSLICFSFRKAAELFVSSSGTARLPRRCPSPTERLSDRAS